MQTVVCPHCKKSFELSDALASELKASVVDELEKKHQEELEKQKILLEEKTAKKIREEMELRFKEKEIESIEAEKKNKQLQEQLLEYIKTNRQLQEKDKERELETQKKITEETEKIRIEAQKKAQEAEHTKLLAKDKQLQDTLKELEDAKRKLEQGSQQLQGETFELEFEKLLAIQYPNDKIVPVGKGVKGGDIIQEVWDRKGNFVGKILWELKNTKNWSEGWIDKLKTDQRGISAEEAVLISEILPADIKVAGFRNPVWVTQRTFVIPLADTLRAKLIQLYYVKNSVQGKDQKMEILYGYLSGTEFKHRVEAIVDAFTNMQTEIEKEKRYFASKWSRDEKHIRQVIDNTLGMHGDLKGIIGNSLPQIKELEVFEIEASLES